MPAFCLSDTEVAGEYALVLTENFERWLSFAPRPYCEYVQADNGFDEILIVQKLQPLRRGVLTLDHDVDVMTASQEVVHYR